MAETKRVSIEPTFYAVVCGEHGLVYLTPEEYDRQMNAPDSLWKCPSCGTSSEWSDENYERMFAAVECSTQEENDG